MFEKRRLSRTFAAIPANREVSEWLKEHAWKACKSVTASRVRLSSSLQNAVSAIRNGIFCVRDNWRDKINFQDDERPQQESAL